MLEVYQKWFEENRSSIREDFFSFLRFATISTDPMYKEEMLSCTQWLISYFKRMGMEAEVWETPGHPTVFATDLKGDSQAPTLLFYGHYDVQPVVPLEEWKSAPFEPEIRDGDVYARGAIDNKGQAFYTLTGVRAFLELSKQSNINIKVLIEGEEEVGSLGLEKIAEEKRKELEADYVFVVDLDMYDAKTPAVTLGIRGVANLNITVRNANVDLHSGVYGGFLFNPARALGNVIGKLWDAKGCVTVPGFYEGIRSLSQEEHSALDWEMDMKEHADVFDAKALQGEGDFSLLESNWIRPTLEINGMESGYTGEGFKTIIPGKAMVKLSCRLVEGQNPEKILDAIEAFVKKNLPEGMELKVEKGAGTSGFLSSPNSKIVEKTVQAYEKVFQVPCRRILCGATIPIVPLLSRICGGELVMMGMGLPSDGMHAPNECFGWERFEKGFFSIAQILEDFSHGD